MQPSSSGLPCQRSLFDIPDDVAYLNCAYMSPLLRSVRDAGLQGVEAKVQPWGLTTDDFFGASERIRRQAGALIGDDGEGIALVPSASYGLSCAARNLALAPGDRVLVLDEQFPSNVYVWKEAVRASGARLETVRRPEDGDWTRQVLESLDERTRVVALPHCHWTDGGLLDLVRIQERCRDAGAALVLDLTQSLGALPFDVREVKPDYMISAGYKWLLGPYSLGILWVAPQHREGQPIEYNWISRQGAENFARLVDYQDDYQPGARRFDVGERSNFVLVPMLNAALEQIGAWTVEAVQATLARRTRSIARRGAALGLESMPDSLRAGHFLGLRFPGGRVPEGLLPALAQEQVYVSVRGSSMRVTPHLYNNEEDVDRLFSALERVLD